MELLHGRVEIHQPHAHAYHTDDGQLQLITGLFDGGDAVIGVVIKRILENIHAIKAELLGLMQPVDQPDAVLFPGGVNHSEFHLCSCDFFQFNGPVLFGALVRRLHESHGV